MIVSSDTDYGELIAVPEIRALIESVATGIARSYNTDILFPEVRTGIQLAAKSIAETLFPRDWKNRDAFIKRVEKEIAAEVEKKSRLADHD